MVHSLLHHALLLGFILHVWEHGRCSCTSARAQCDPKEMAEGAGDRSVEEQVKAPRALGGDGMLKSAPKAVGSSGCYSNGKVCRDLDGQEPYRMGL